MATHFHSTGQEPAADRHHPEQFKVGTLIYTKAGLITLFLYLLWGDFCFCLMETVVPSILPLKFNAVGAPNWTLGLIVTTIPNIMNMVINPFASFRSDRFRSKWGRRIPFLAGATPFLVFFLILLGYCDAIGRWLRGMGMGAGLSEMAVLVGVIGVLMVCFQFFNLLITSVYYYLFNDVVPQAFLARFMALFRMVAALSSAVYNYFIYKYAYTHMQEIFLGSGLLYLMAFGLMCWKIKEGGYPPPPPNIGNQSGLWASVKTYAVECFTHRFYWCLFLLNACGAIGAVAGPYSVLLVTKVVGIDLATFGKVTGLTGLITALLLYPAGAISDRFHPLRVLLVCSLLGLCTLPFKIAFYFMSDHFTPDGRLYIWIGLSAVYLPLSALGQASDLPLLMKLLPQERYGQFCSANALVRSFGLIGGGVACGVFLDAMKGFHPNPDYCYRFVSIWWLVFGLGSFTLYWLLYREWKRLGGLRHYVPPGSAVSMGPEHVAVMCPVSAENAVALRTDDLS
jgi:MFS family permease